MEKLTLITIALPLFVGFLIYLIPKVDRILSLLTVIFTATYALLIIINQLEINLVLLDSYGVELLVNSLSGYFIFTNALVTSALLLYTWNTGKKTIFFTQAIILHGSVNAVFISADFLSVYVALEVVSIATFLLITYERGDRKIWVGLRYLFTSNIAMLFYLIGTILVYKSNNSFAFAGLSNTPPEGIALIFMGLLTKGGVFISGLWLPLTHSESASPVSGLLSGIVVKTGVFPLLRCVLINNDFYEIISVIGIGSALLGIIYAIFEKDTKRVLASSTIAQLGWIMVAPEMGGYFALAHGVGKTTMFLASGVLPSRNFAELAQKPLSNRLWLVILIAGLSISGLPLFYGFTVKVETLKSLAPFSQILMNMAAVGTAMVYAKFIFLPHQKTEDKTSVGFWLAITPLIAVIFLGNFINPSTYTVINILKKLGLGALGFVLHLLLVKKINLTIPRYFEKLEEILGVMTLTIVLLFWMVIKWSPVSFFG